VQQQPTTATADGANQAVEIAAEAEEVEEDLLASLTKKHS
jgi:hypothetical protein